MTTLELLSTDAAVTEENARDALTNNVCRCTGYNNIVKAVMDANRTLHADKETD